MNKNIFILVILILNIYTYNNIINSNLTLKYSNHINKNIINFKILFFQYLGNITGSYFFSKKKIIKKIPIILYLDLLFLNIFFCIIKYEKNFLFCLFYKIFIGFLISSINNTSETYISQFNKRISSFYSSILYFSSFIGQNLLVLFNLIYSNYNNIFYLFIFFFTILYNKIILLLKDIDLKNKKILRFKNLKKTNIFIIIIFMFIIFFISIINNYVNNMFRKSINNELSIFTNYMSFGGAVSFFIMLYLNNKDKKKLLLSFLCLLLLLSSIITLFLNFKQVKCFILFSFGFCTFPIYFVSCTFLNKRLSKKNNIIYSISNSLAYGLCPFFSVLYNKNNVFKFFFVIKFITIILIFILFLL